jgi:hypothetical protein
MNCVCASLKSFLQHAAAATHANEVKKCGQLLVDRNILRRHEPIGYLEVKGKPKECMLRHSKLLTESGGMAIDELIQPALPCET